MLDGLHGRDSDGRVGDGRSALEGRAGELMHCWEPCGVGLYIGFIWLMVMAGAFEQEDDLQGYTRCFVGQLGVLLLLHVSAGLVLRKGQHVRYLHTYLLN